MKNCKCHSCFSKRHGAIDLPPIVVGGLFSHSYDVRLCTCNICQTRWRYVRPLYTGEWVRWRVDSEVLRENEGYVTRRNVVGGKCLTTPVCVAWDWVPPVFARTLKEKSLSVPNDMPLIVVGGSGLVDESLPNVVWALDLSPEITMDAWGPYGSVRAAYSIVQTFGTLCCERVLHWWPSGLLSSDDYVRLWSDEEMQDIWMQGANQDLEIEI